MERLTLASRLSQSSVCRFIDRNILENRSTGCAMIVCVWRSVCYTPPPGAAGLISCCSNASTHNQHQSYVHTRRCLRQSGNILQIISGRICCRCVRCIPGSAGDQMRIPDSMWLGNENVCREPRIDLRVLSTACQTLSVVTPLLPWLLLTRFHFDMIC